MSTISSTSARIDPQPQAHPRIGSHLPSSPRNPIESGVLRPEDRATEVPMRAYYSRSSELTIHMSPGRLVHDGEKLVRIGQRHLKFNPIGGGNLNGNQWGHLRTTDPEVIRFLEDRRVTAGDVLSQQEFEIASKSPAFIQQEATRQVESSNRLVQDMERQKNEVLEQNIGLVDENEKLKRELAELKAKNASGAAASGPQTPEANKNPAPTTASNRR